MKLLENPMFFLKIKEWLINILNQYSYYKTINLLNPYFYKLINLWRLK